MKNKLIYKSVFLLLSTLSLFSCGKKKVEMELPPETLVLSHNWYYINADGFNKINLQKNATRNVSVIPNIQNANNIRIEQDNYIYGSNILDNTDRQVEYESVYNAHAVLNSADIDERELPGTEHTVIDYEIRSDN